MATLSIKDVDADWLRSLKIRALEAGLTLRDYVLAQLSGAPGDDTRPKNRGPK